MATESKISFFDSLIKIGHGFQEIFGVFGNAIGDAFGFTAVKSGDKRSKVGEHFDKIRKGLEDTKGKLDGLVKDITSTPHADTTGVEATIKSASDVIVKLIDSVTKLAGATGDTDISDGAGANAVAVGAEVASVKTVIEEVKAIIDVADKSGVKVKAGNAGVQVAGGAATAGAALVGKADAAAPAAGAGSKLADEVTKADSWAMIDKIKNAKFEGALAAGDNNEAGVLAVGIAGNGGDNHNGAKTNADLVAAVALKAMTKGGKFSAANDDAEAVKAAAASAVNKVLGVLDIIIKKTVESELDKVGEAVKGIKYSETTIEATEATTIQPAAAK
ncbi:variable large family protein (plasmid) [Borrelia turicatae 91E135]|uniref:Variable large protein n=1 Tax=Borrelia turicatae (strain 91E135) TaxID=314724 RepID=A0ABF7R047_BORT9|nr:VlpB4 [Borrelia turicatae 91E135]UPA14186.1 variable large family protein [Borrelia turicatae 91E135]